MRLTIRICSALTLTVLFASLALQASAGTIFHDNFNDGNLLDGDPVSWDGDGSISIVSGDLVLTGLRVPNVRTFFPEIEGASIRTVLELVRGGSAGVAVGYGPSGRYFASLRVDPLDDSVIHARIMTGGAICCEQLGDSVEVPFDPRQEPIALQIDRFSDNVRIWAWPANETMPTEPLLEVNDSRVSVIESAGLLVTGKDWRGPDPQIGTTRFDYIHVADSHIPEPSTILLAMLGMAGTCCYRRRR